MITYIKDKICIYSILAICKCLIITVASIIILSQGQNIRTTDTSGLKWSGAGITDYGSHLAAWDGAHYLHLSRDGYSKGDSSCAFYPFWPSLVREMSRVARGNYLVSGMVLANVFSLFAWVLFSSLVEKRWGINVSWWAIIILIAFPGALFYQFPYSESVFFLLVLGLWYGLEHQRYGVVAITAFLLPLTRGIGVFSILPIGWHAIGVA